MKTLRKLLAAGMSLLLLLPSLVLPMQATAAEDDYQILAEFKYTALGSGIEKGVGTGTNQVFYADAPIDLSDYAEGATTGGASITAPDVYIQMDINATYSAANNLVFLQAHSASSLINAAASPKERAAMDKMAGRWYTVSAPLSFPSGYGGNNDGIDVSDLRSMTYHIPATSSIQMKNLRIVKITNAELRAELTAEVNEDLEYGDEYISLEDYNAAKADAQAALDNAGTSSDDLMTAWNLLRCVKEQLEPLPQGVYKGALEAALAETLPDEAEYDRDLVAAWEAAKEDGQAVYDDRAATQQQVNDALQAITDARAVIYDITYMIADFPPVAGSNDEGVYAWAISGDTNFGLSTLSEPVDMSAHDPAKLRFRVDIRLVEGDATKLGNLTLQPRDIDNKMNNAWDATPPTVLGDGEWHTFERDFSGNYSYDNWYMIKTACLHMQTSAPVTLEVRDFRIVDITLDDTKAALQALIDKPVGDASLYPDSIWQVYQAAVAAAKKAIAEATTNTSIYDAMDTLQAVLNDMGNRGALMAAIEEILPADRTYTAASIAVWEAAKQAGLAVLQGDTATDEDITAALLVIEAAKDALVETTFLAGQFPMADQPETAYQNMGKYSVTDGVYRYEGTTGSVNSVAGFATEKVDLTHHDRTKLYMQFDIKFDEGSADRFTAFFIRPTKSNAVIQNHDATAAVNAAADKQGVWHTITTALSATIDLSELAGMSFYMSGADTSAQFALEVKDFRIVDLSDEPMLNSLFADGMMFQQNKPISVFGQGGVGETVTVALTKDADDETVDEQTVTVGENGRWQADLKALEGGYDTYTLSVRGDVMEHTYHDILIGEVWVAGGQSNMENSVQNDLNNTSILEKTDEYIRIFYEPSLVYGNEVDQPLTPDFNLRNGVWADGTDANRLKSASAVAYNFALVLRDELDVPVGFLNTALGGTFIEAWISREGIDGDEAVKTYLQERNRYYDEENWPQRFNRMSALYNQKIGALAGYNVAGTLWYQGESNLQSGDLSIYTDLLNLLQQDWGRTFGYSDGDMPFIFAHIAPHTYTAGGYSQATTMAYFWEAMSDAWANNSDSMAQVPLYDLPLTHWFTQLNGESVSRGPIHPADKTPVGQRFAAAALGLVYSGDEAGTAPVYKSMEVADGKIRVTFDQVGSGLKIKDGAPTLHGFAIAGADGVYVDAYARIISADTVEVWNDRVPEPQNVTYAFSSFNMTANLQNAVGIAAAPFRSTRDTVDGNLYLPRDWQYADGEVWIATGGNDTTRWEDLWRSDAATLTYNSETKAEGTASLKADYPAGTVGIGPVYGKNSVSTDYSNFNTVSIRIKNPDDREKILKLQFTNGNTVYTAALADQGDAAALETRATLAANSDFTIYAFDLTKLIDPRNNMANEATARNILRSSIAVNWVIVDSATGTVYLDDVQFGREALADGEVDTAALEEAIAEADAIDTSLYTAESVAALEQALQAAKAALNNTNATQSDITAALGNLKTAIAGLEPIKDEIVPGDVDGKDGVTAADALMALQIATGKINPTDAQKRAADVDGTEGVEASDALLILQKATGKIARFPIEKTE